MPQAAAQRGPQVLQHAFGGNREEASFQAATEQVDDQIDEAVEREKPHRREVPLQGAAEPAAEGDRIGKAEIVER